MLISIIIVMMIIIITIVPIHTITTHMFIISKYFCTTFLTEKQLLYFFVVIEFIADILLCMFYQHFKSLYQILNGPP